MSPSPHSPIGVFDSGVGGLTVVRALMQRLPNEDIIYFGDTARVPYGIKSVETISHYATQITEFLLEKEVKLLIVACNTMAAVASQVIHDLSPVPVLDVIEAGTRGAIAATRNRQVGVIGTLTTINSQAYVHTIHAAAPDIGIHSRACPLFVPLVEEGWLDHEVTRLTAREYLSPLLELDIDSLVLGCTHYPLLTPLLKEVVGDSIQLIDSAETTAQQVVELFEQTGMANPDPTPGSHQFFVTDVPQRFQDVGSRFLGQPLFHVHVVNW
ncbi:MAG: glutamate racemase [Gammaproteobacteria bacterium]|nr:glutamate racemase [Gammaproteobacteria bacterium]